MSLPNGFLSGLKGAIKATLPKSFLLKRYTRMALANGDPELKIVPFLCRRAEIAIDVGANEGIYSYIFSQHCDHVIAVEPHPLLAAQLKRALPASVQIMDCAASNEDGTADIFIPLSNGVEIRTRCSLEADANPEFCTRTIRVPTRRLDGIPLNGRAVAVVKIDVEGHELPVLQGLAGILGQFKPSIIVESEARHNAGAPFDTFKQILSYGYDGYFIYRSRLLPLSEFSVERFQSLSEAKSVLSEQSTEYINNFIFIHPDRHHVLSEITQLFPFAVTSQSTSR